MDTFSSILPEDIPLAGNVARYVELLDVYLTDISAKLLVEKGALFCDGFADGLNLDWKHAASYHYNVEKHHLLTQIHFELQISREPEGEEKTEILFLNCSYALLYLFRAEGGPVGEERDRYFSAFARLNGLYHVWPYFREQAQVTIAKMGFPFNIVLPVIKIPSLQHADTSKSDDKTKA